MHLYLHIPFCRRACHYCDFHFSTNLGSKSQIVEAICREITLQSEYLANKELQTIYFGGGTPSLLNLNELYDIFETIKRHYQFSDNIEITMEANPDDITPDKLKIFQRFGINRLSIGIQTFHEGHLKYLNRIHHASDAENCVIMAKNMGFDNITIDLIYGIPPIHAFNKVLLTENLHEIWENDLAKAIQLGVNHISSYCLTIEEKTVFGKWQNTHKIPPIDEEFASAQFEILVSTLENAGFEQYEISNFCKNQHYSKHNTSYWQGHEYLGIGPSAHSYNGISRQFNVANNAIYLKNLAQDIIPAEIEILSQTEQINDYLLTGLRTKWGCRMDEIENLAGKKWFLAYDAILKKYDSQGLISLENHTIVVTRKGRLFADRIASDLFVLSE